MRLENPSANLYEALKGANSGIREQLAPRLDFETGFTTGRNIEQADIFDFIEYMIRQGDAGKEVNEAVELLPKLREKYNAFKGSTPPTPPTPPHTPKPTLESQAGKEASTEATEVIHKEAQATPAETPAQKVDSSVAYTDTKGHTHQIPSDIAQQWLETFGLKDLQETYTPQFSEQVVKALESTLQGEQITLSANSLVKLMQRDRLEFLPYIKETLEHSDIIIKDKENALIFAKDIGQTSYFTSVSKNDKGEWIISTNSYKTLSQLKNRVSENGEVLYLSKEAPNILAETFTTKAFSNELASDIIPQPTQTKLEYDPLLRELEKYNAIVKNNEAKGINPYLLPNKEAKQAKEMQEALQEILSQTPQAKERAQQIAKEITQAYNDRLRTKINVFNKLPTKTQSQEQKRLERLKELEQIRDEILAPYRDEFAKFGWKAHDQLFVYPQAINKDGKEVILPIADDAQVLIGSHFEIYKLVPTLEKYARENPHNKQYASKLEQFRKHEQEYKQKLQQQEKLVQEHFSSTPHTSTPPKDTQAPAETQAPKVDSSEAPPSKINFTYTTGEAKGIAELRKDLKAALEPSLNKEIVNKETGIAATISTKGLTKISSSKAVAKSVKNGFTRDEHFKVAQDLKNLFESSKLKESHTDTKARDEIQAVYRFTKDLEINGSQAEAKITLFENNQAGNRIYSIELESLEKPTPLSPSATQTKAGAADLTQSVGGDANPTNIAKTDGEIIPQTQISNIKKQLVELKQSKSAYEKYLKSLERNMKDVELEERRYLRGEERIKVFERKRLIQSSIDEHTQGLNAVLKKMMELHKQLPENVRYTKEVLDDLTKIEAILKGNNYSLEQALRLSKITQRLQEKAIIENESFLNKVYKLDDFAKGAKSLQGTSYTYNTDESIKRYFKTIAEMIDFIPAFKKISANQPETPPKVDSSDAPKELESIPTKKSQREQVKQQLQSIKNIDITHKSGIVARVSSIGIDKMLSDKAIQKSLDNGFSQEQHFSAVANIERLFKNSDFSHTEAPKNQSADIVGVHRYINTQDLQEQNAQALITLKESIENGNRIYSVELEGLTHPSSVDRSPKSKGVENSHHDDAGATKAARLFENSTSNSTTKTFNQTDIKLEALSDFSKFARLAGFGDLNEQELESAHKHILANLQRIEC